MASIKWSSKGLELSHPIIAIEEMAAWLRDNGHVFDKAIEELRASWFFGERRAKEKIFARLSDTIDGSERLHLALEQSLAKLPRLIGSTSARIENAGPRALGTANNSGWLVVVPRAFVRSVYKRALFKDLAQLAELAQFRGMPERFLARKAQESETLFFRMVKKHGYYVSSNSGMIFGVHPSFDWHWGVAGHYYYGESTRLDQVLTKREDRKGFQANMKAGLKRKKTEIGVLNAQKIQEIVDSLRH